LLAAFSMAASFSAASSLRRFSFSAAFFSSNFFVPFLGSTLQKLGAACAVLFVCTVIPNPSD